MPRPGLGIEYKEKIAYFMLNSEVTRSPMMTKLIANWAISMGWSDYPAERTVTRWMSRIRMGQLPLLSKRKDFHWPMTMGNNDDEIAWPDSRTALDCLQFYLTQGHGRPSTGLTQWFVRVAQADPDLAVQSIALKAEMFWCAEILSHTPGYQRPSTTVEELTLAIQPSKANNISVVAIVKQLRADRYRLPHKALRFALQMPQFAKILRQSPSFDSSSRRG